MHHSKYLILLLTITFFSSIYTGQAQSTHNTYPKHGVTYSAGLFKSWLTDSTVGFHEIEDSVTPVFEEQKKMGFALNSHYMYKPTKMIGLGIHLGIGLDVNSYTQAPVLLFGGTVSYGKKNNFIINFGWADGKRKKVSGTLRNQLNQIPLTEIPTIHQETELNTGLYLGISYRVF